MWDQIPSNSGKTTGTDHFANGGALLAAERLTRGLRTEVDGAGSGWSEETEDKSPSSSQPVTGTGAGTETGSAGTGTGSGTGTGTEDEGRGWPPVCPHSQAT